MTVIMDELVPLDYFLRLTRLWWLIVACMLLGGLAGIVFNRVQPPIYEATSSLYVAVDLDKLVELGIDKDQLQYNEDLALSVADWAFRSPDVQAMVLSAAQAQALPVNSTDLADHSSIQRRHAFWDLHFRDEDPTVAQAIANIWSQIAYEALVSWQAAGTIEEYLIFQPPIPAELPQKPTSFDLFQMILAGTLIGFIAGTTLANLLVGRLSSRQRSERAT
jgi:uncharacterized protein involved in exopolysaccharide biosynthesis